MGKKGENKIISQIKKSIKKEMKDTRGQLESKVEREEKFRKKPGIIRGIYKAVIVPIVAGAVALSTWGCYEQHKPSAYEKIPQKLEYRIKRIKEEAKEREKELEKQDREGKGEGNFWPIPRLSRPFFSKNRK